MAKFTSKTKSKDVAVFASSAGEGVHGETTSDAAAAIAGVSENTQGHGAGVYGRSKGRGPGVVGENLPDAGGVGGDGVGGFFKSEKLEGLVAETISPHRAAFACFQKNPSSDHPAIHAEHVDGNRTAGFFKGNVIVTGDLSFPGADFAEDFTVDEEVVAEPGTVMAFGETGELVPCSDPYEKKVVGVVAGAGSFRTAIVMDRQQSGEAVRRQPIALVGKVFCKVDASYASIEVGDLLTSSATAGYAMKASDPGRAFGAVIGKAMAPLAEGHGLIPILISLQ
jgi:hypothetical protein